MSKNNGYNMELKAMNDPFTTEEERADARLEKVQNISLLELHTFSNHPFKVLNDEAMDDLMSSIKKNGVLEPAIARPDPKGGYELVSGHRRHRACARLGLTTMPVIVRNMDDDTAILVMVDSNLQHRELLPSEKAFSYKMKLEAIKRQGARTDLTSGQVVQKSAIQKVAEEAGENYKQVQRFIRLTNLHKTFLDMADKKEIAFMTAYELSFLKPDEQENLLTAMDLLATKDQASITPVLQQAKRMKECSQESALSLKVIRDILSGNDTREPHKLVIPIELVKKFFPATWTKENMMNVTIQLLEKWHEDQIK